MGDVVPTDEADNGHELPPARVVLKDTVSDRKITSSREPFLIGSHNVCHMRVADEDAACFHAQVYWGQQGIHIRDLGAISGTFVNDAPIHDAPLGAADEIEVGSARLKIDQYGDVAGRCQHLSGKEETKRTLALTCISGPCQRASGALPLRDQTLVLGRDRKCDLRIDDPYASARHASLTVREDAIDIEDVGTRNGVKVNGKKAHSTTLKIGDVVCIGRSELLVHHVL